jgi:hypothetical protein
MSSNKDIGNGIPKTDTNGNQRTEGKRYAYYGIEHTPDTFDASFDGETYTFEQVTEWIKNGDLKEEEVYFGEGTARRPEQKHMSIDGYEDGYTCKYFIIEPPAKNNRKYSNFLRKCQAKYNRHDYLPSTALPGCVNSQIYLIRLASKYGVSLVNKLLYEEYADCLPKKK